MGEGSVYLETDMAVSGSTCIDADIPLALYAAPEGQKAIPRRNPKGPKGSWHPNPRSDPDHLDSSRHIGGMLVPKDRYIRSQSGPVHCPTTPLFRACCVAFGLRSTFAQLPILTCPSFGRSPRGTR
jgi:hypothetical protein